MGPPTLIQRLYFLQSTWSCSICRRKRQSRTQPVIAQDSTDSLLDVPLLEALQRRHSDVKLGPGGACSAAGGLGGGLAPPRSPELRRHSDVSPASLKEIEKVSIIKILLLSSSSIDFSIGKVINFAEIHSSSSRYVSRKLYGAEVRFLISGVWRECLLLYCLSKSNVIKCVTTGNLFHLKMQSSRATGRTMTLNVRQYFLLTLCIWFLNIRSSAEHKYSGSLPRTAFLQSSGLIIFQIARSHLYINLLLKNGIVN